MTKLVLPASMALALGISGAAWAQCSGYSKQTQTTAEAPVEKPAEPAPQS
ncbi:hypothetical protein M1105_05120 [Limibaculum sp. FT325]|nr:hypothetical protein [Limibaculum sediminis]MCL5776372.1 hypothetical protein [Limibaculum sediminis]